MRLNLKARTHGFEPRVEVLEASTAPRQSSVRKWVEAGLNCCRDIFSVVCSQLHHQPAGEYLAGFEPTPSPWQGDALPGYAIGTLTLLRPLLGPRGVEPRPTSLRARHAANNTSVPWHLLNCQRPSRRHSLRRQSINQESNLGQHITSVPHCHYAIDANSGALDLNQAARFIRACSATSTSRPKSASGET